MPHGPLLLPASVTAAPVETIWASPASAVGAKGSVLELLRSCNVVSVVRSWKTFAGRLVRALLVRRNVSNSVSPSKIPAGRLLRAL